MKYTGKYEKMDEEFRKDGVDESMVGKFIQEEMERDEFRKGRGTTDLNAFRIWQSWPEERRQLYLHNAFCSNCHLTSFAEGYNIRQDAYGLIVEGNCEKCGHRIARCCD